MPVPLLSDETVVSALLFSAAVSLTVAAAIPSARWLAKLFKRLTPMQLVVLLPAVGIATASAQKSGTNIVEEVSNTNDVTNVQSTNGVDIVEGTNAVDEIGGSNVTGNADGEVLPPLLTMLGAPNMVLPPGDPSILVSPADVARGFRLDSVTTNDAISYEMPDNASAVGSWRYTGAYDDVVRADLGEFRFPLGTNLCSSLWVQTWGRARPRLRSVSNELVAVGAPMSAIPGVSRFWTAPTTNETFLLTWQDFALGRIPVPSNTASLVSHPSSLVSAQLELRGNGDFIARSNNVESVYCRINPDDWDDDGIANDEDDNPFACVGTFFGPHQTLPEGANSNAYCWVDIVVRQANARVVFSGNGSSDLPDPSFIARAGETYRVLILIGKTYKVTCDMPLEIVGKSDEAIDDWREDELALWLNWPVHVWSQGDDEGGPLLLLGAGNGANRRKGFTMFVSPSGLGGGFTWTNCCCSVSGNGWCFTYDCQEDCTCGGCAATGYLGYEGYRLPASGGSCGCSTTEEHPDPGHDEPVAPPLKGVFASFSKKVIFLEDEYANTPGEIVPWYSETTEMSCSAWGGENGGRLIVTVSGDSNLIQFGGQTLPFERELEPCEEFAFTNVYKAVAESCGYEDIVVTATFVENDSAWSETSIAKATAVRVEVEPATTKPGCDNRHVLGVGEVLRLFVFPSSIPVDITAESGWTRNARSDDLRFICPLSNSSNGLIINVGGDSYVPSLQVLKPQSIVCRQGRVVDFGFPVGTASGIGMQIEPIIQPESVAFTGIRMIERPTLVGATPPSGYFAAERYSDFWAHTTVRGAGVWRDPNAENLFFLDTASFGEPCPSPWSEGAIDWDIEIGWGDKEAVSLVDVVEDIPICYHQITSISPDGGVKVEKFGQWVKRMPSGSITHSGGIGD